MSPTARADLPTGTATFLFTDIQGSTQLVQALGLERWKEILDTHYRLLREQFDAHDGREVNTEGDAFFIAFAGAADAVAACAGGQRSLHQNPWPEDAVIRVRMGLHTGEAAMVGGDYMGLDIHRAARIASSAHGGQVVISNSTKTLVEGSLPEGVGLVDLGEHRLKDLARPEQIWQLKIEGLPESFPALKTLDFVPNNLPTQLTSFVGREKELAEGRKLLESSRLLTLTGPGGTGKTRLSLQIAAEASDLFKHGVFFVALAPVTDPGLVASTILDALAVTDAGADPPEQRLVTYLRDKELLLVLDNFEQIMTAANLVSDLLKAGPAVKVIATSRASLHVYGEQEFPVPPLGIPDPTALPPLESLSQFAAVKLFIERAVALKPDFVVTNENAPAVAGITSLVDGLPLAIELAAARIKLLPPAAMLERLRTRLSELGGGARDLPERQQTLRGAIAWSYDMLDETAQTLMAHFGVFVRGGGLEQIETVCGTDGVDVLDGIETLVDQNLVRTVEDVEEPRFFIMNVIREFALERLSEMADADDVRRRHADSFLNLAETAAPELSGADQKVWLDRLELEHDNIRAALALFVAADDGDSASRLLAALWRFWQMRGHLFEARHRADEVLAMSSLTELTLQRYAALEASGGIAYWQGDADASERFYGEALEIARVAGHRATLAEALYNAAFPLVVAGRNPDQARVLGRESAELFDALDDAAGRAKVLWAIGIIPVYMEPPDWAAAIPPLSQARDAFRELGDRFGLGWALYTLGLAQAQTGELEDAEAGLRESLGIFADVDDMSGMALLINGFAILALKRGDPDRAARLHGARLAVEAATGIGLASQSVPTGMEDDFRTLSERFPEPFAEGSAMGAQAAIAYALAGAAEATPGES
jgi:predicted ATPase/class 3 adenylate cyclase